MNSITDFLSQTLALGQNMNFWNVLFAVGISYLGGVFASLTPCVYPMIPITVSVVGGIGPTRRPWRQIYLRGITYVAGMTVVYSFLGVIAGMTGKVFGSLTNNSAWYLGIGLIMTFAALVMLDVIPFDPLIWWENFKRNILRMRSTPNASSVVQQELTLVGTFILGATSGFIAAPCTTPVLTSILAFIAQTQSVGVGFILMCSFSLGLGTLLIVIALFAGAIQILPRSGQWMKTAKIISGLILLAFADYLIYRAGNCGGP